MGANPLPFPEYSTELRAAIETSHTFISEVEDIGQDELGATCGSSVLKETLTLSKDMKKAMNKLVKLSDALSGPNGAFTCETLMPIYDEAINEAACGDTIGYGVHGFTFLSAVSIFSLIMIVCRPLPEVINADCDEEDMVKEVDVEENADNDKNMPCSGDDETNSNTNSALPTDLPKDIPTGESIVNKEYDSRSEEGSTGEESLVCIDCSPLISWYLLLFLNFLLLFA